MQDLAQHLPQKSISGARLNDEKKMLAEIADKLGRHTKVADVHNGDITDMRDRITKDGRPVRANRILAIASKMFALALVSMPGENTPWRAADLGNPCKGIKRNPEEARDRFFSQDELTKIAEALMSHSKVAKTSRLASKRFAGTMEWKVRRSICSPLPSTWSQYPASLSLRSKLNSERIFRESFSWTLSTAASSGRSRRTRTWPNIWPRLKEWLRS